MAVPVKIGRPGSIAPRPKWLGPCWLAIAAFALGLYLLAPIYCWLPVMWATPVAFAWTGMYFLNGPRAARRYWLTVRLLLTNWNRPAVVIDRVTRKRSHQVVVGKHAFEDLLRRMRT